MFAKIYFLVTVLALVGCSGDNNYFDITKSKKGSYAISQSVKITTSKFVNGQLRIGGTCGEEGEILLIIPANKNDNRIIGSPKCNNGRYEIITYNFGRPPCEVIVEYGKDSVAKAEVAGADIYCH